MSVKLPKRITDKNGKQNTVYVSATPTAAVPKRLAGLFTGKGKRVMSVSDAEKLTDVIKTSKIGFLLNDSDRAQFVEDIQYAKSFKHVPNTDYSEIKIKNYDESIELTFTNHKTMGIWNVNVKHDPTSAYSFDSAHSLRNRLKSIAESIRLERPRS